MWKINKIKAVFSIVFHCWFESTDLKHFSCKQPSFFNELVIFPSRAVPGLLSIQKIQANIGSRDLKTIVNSQPFVIHVTCYFRCQFEEIEDPGNKIDWALPFHCLVYTALQIVQLAFVSGNSPNEPTSLSAVSIPSQTMGLDWLPRMPNADHSSLLERTSSCSKKEMCSFMWCWRPFNWKVKIKKYFTGQRLSLWTTPSTDSSVSF